MRPAIRWEICFAVPSDSTVRTDDVHKVVCAYLPAYTIIESAGCWDYAAERGYCVTYVSFNSVDSECSVYELAEAIKKYFKQESVLLTQSPIMASLL